MSADKPPKDTLSTYRQKRRAAHTPEPFGGRTPTGAPLFVVQRHAATRLHYDFRLAFGGVLKSWAVPKGPSLNPADKRLAVHVEDHPLEYADFEGVIPEGNYGAGTVIVWDIGYFEAVEDMTAGLTRGKLLFDLYGHKLRGRFTLVRASRSEKEWLLIKKPDAYAIAEGEPSRADDQSSVLSGLDIEQRAAAVKKSEEFLNTVHGLPRFAVPPAQFRPMLAQTRQDAFSDAAFVFEIKYDGYRLVAHKRGDEVELRYRSGIVATKMFPDIVRSVRHLPVVDAIVDGEVVVQDKSGLPNFQLLQRRVAFRTTSEIALASVLQPATYYVFDLVCLEGCDLRKLSLLERKAWLEKITPRYGVLRYSEHVPGAGEAVFEQALKIGLEGVVAKRADASYVSGRSEFWYKIRSEHTSDFIIVGFTAPKGGRMGFGALLLGAYNGVGLVYVGRVGTGFDEGLLQRLTLLLSDVIRANAPCDIPQNGDGMTFVEPVYVCEVRFKEVTDDGLLRHSVFVRLRLDKAASECRLEGSLLRQWRQVSQKPVEPVADEVQQVEITNSNKVFWPELGITKGELIEYYRAIAPWILPYLHDRPVVLTRYPDGIDGPSFFQKDAPAWCPPFVRTETMWSDDADRQIRHFVCENADALVYIANMAAIAVHVWASRLSSPSRPDWCILDLDPKGAPFTDVVRIARFIHGLCESCAMPNFVKTSGATGLHILMPLGGQCTFEQSQQLAGLIAHVVVNKLPKIATVARSIAAREGKVYVDYLQNGHGKLLVSPYSVRPVPAASVSMPLRWSEVNKNLDVSAFTLRSALERVRRMKKDPMLDVLRKVPDLGEVLARIDEKFIAK